ncbi:MAG: phosphatase PAP2 family protein [Deltaproteobacteria bacterium]|nr:phosphatase PAP2 family protein [Deltaproteobacteria bacterium]
MAEAVSELTGDVPVDGSEPPGLHLRAADLLAISVPLLFGSALISGPDRTREVWISFFWLLFAAVLGVVGRLIASRSAHWAAQAAGSYYIIVNVYLSYRHVSPLIDRVSPVVYDRDLQAIDQWIFGTQPSIWLERFHHPWLTEILFISYSLFFFWQVALGTLLFLKKRQDFHAYVLLVVAFYLLSYVMYLMVPAIGPRFDLLSQYQYPLTGVFLAKHIEASFIDIPMVRDCFPSGHTGLTLLTLYQAWRSGMKKFFFVMLPFGLLLIFSTVYCRFHYVVDLLCALPFLTGILLLRHGLLTALPDGIYVPLRRRGMARASA